MILPSEKELRTVLARFAQARIEHHTRPTEHTARALEDVSYTLCVMTGVPDVAQALATADTMLDRCRADRAGVAAPRETETLAA